jgi:alkanesulfonate monooxygenase SsuD/methylene tetrahydromethanopterin reductase-like flavin-dependent oxidoreductase (luciferase family)
MPLWIGGGASESTAELAARRGRYLMLPSAFGNPSMFVPVVETYREKCASYGHTHQPRIGARGERPKLRPESMFCNRRR